MTTGHNGSDHDNESHRSNGRRRRYSATAVPRRLNEQSDKRNGNAAYKMRQTRRAFWQHTFPWKAFEHWVTHGGRYRLSQRQIVFLMLIDGEEKWSLPRRILRTIGDVKRWAMNKACVTMQIGPIWPSPDERELAYSLRWDITVPWETELRLDIDMDDYKTLRENLPGCFCSDKNVGGKGRTCCNICWETWIVQVVYPMLCYMLGPIGWDFQHWQVIYSGRRGIHVWIWDARVMPWTSQQRQLFLNTLIRPSPIHAEYLITELYRPAMQRAFLDTCAVTTADQALHAICTKALRTQLGTEANIPIFDTDDPEEEQDEEGDAPVMAFSEWIGHASQQFEQYQYEWWLDDIATRMMAPRFDAGVTIKPDHMTKSPLVPHPKTHNVTQPIRFTCDIPEPDDKGKEEEDAPSPVSRKGQQLAPGEWMPGSDPIHFNSVSRARMDAWACDIFLL